MVVFFEAELPVLINVTGSANRTSGAGTWIRCGFKVPTRIFLPFIVKNPWVWRKCLCVNMNGWIKLHKTEISSSLMCSLWLLHLVPFKIVHASCFLGSCKSFSKRMNRVQLDQYIDKSLISFLLTKKIISLITMSFTHLFPVLVVSYSFNLMQLMISVEVASSKNMAWYIQKWHYISFIMLSRLE